ncbi:hypothetical protein CRBSH125_34960 [Afipia carboxidovorans]|nr:hypothetical protein CRBSH125_34960 [Afipia carboxidovorans]
MFRIGQKVVCVNDSNIHPCWSDWHSDLIVKGRVYTIASIERSRDRFGFTLTEINSKPWPTGGYAAWRAERFRPVVERKTDISIFKAMLNPSSRETEAA